MTTDHDRLKDWMKAQGHDTRSLSTLLSFVQDVTKRFLNTGNAFSGAYRWQFARVCGDDAASAIFAEPVPSTARLGYFNPARDAAHRKMQWKMSREVVPPANKSRCCICRKRQAKHNHHPSYEADQQLSVYPLCVPCHQRVHHGSAKLQLRLQLDGTPNVQRTSKKKSLKPVL